MLVLRGHGTTDVAAALGVPTVAIFGASDSIRSVATSGPADSVGVTGGLRFPSAIARSAARSRNCSGEMPRAELDIERLGLLMGGLTGGESDP